MASIKTGKRNNQDKTEHGKYPFYVRSQQVERIGSFSFDGEAILVPGEGNIGEIFHYINGKFDYHQRVYKVSNFNVEVFGKYLYYTLKAKFGTWALEQTVKATVDSIRLPTFQKFQFVLPPIDAQKSIASALSIIDIHISSLRRLIAKQEAIKKSTLKLLLTPKADWKTVKLGGVVKTSSGGTPSRDTPDFFDGSHLWVTTSELNDGWISETNEHISDLAIASSAAKPFPVNTVLLAMYGATIGKLGILAQEATTNQACCALLCNPTTMYFRFLFFWLLSKRNELIEMGYGAGQPNISQQVIINLEMKLPTLREQHDIAITLTQLDNHLVFLHKQLTKVQQLKAGVMRHFFG